MRCQREAVLHKMVLLVLVFLHSTDTMSYIQHNNLECLFISRRIEIKQNTLKEVCTAATS